MSVFKFILTLPSPHFQPSRRHDRIPIKESSLFALSRASPFRGVDQGLPLWIPSRTSRVAHWRCRAIPGTPPPSLPFDLTKWVGGIAITMLLHILGGKWRSLGQLKTEIETAVETVEVIVETVEKVAEGVEKVAEDIAEELPEGSKLRETIDLVEHVAEIAAKDAHLVDDFIDKVQEAEAKVEAFVESAITAEESPEPPPSVTTNDNNRQEICP